jgi:hypothetical protein
MIESFRFELLIPFVLSAVRIEKESVERILLVLIHVLTLDVSHATTRRIARLVGTTAITVASRPDNRVTNRVVNLDLHKPILAPVDN